MGGSPNKLSLWVGCILGYTLLSPKLDGRGDAINDKDHIHPTVTIGRILLTMRGKDHNYPIVQSSLNPTSSSAQFLSPGAQTKGKNIPQCSRSRVTLSREGHIHQSKLLSEDQELPFWKRLGKNVKT